MVLFYLGAIDCENTINVNLHLNIVIDYFRD